MKKLVKKQVGEQSKRNVKLTENSKENTLNVDLKNVKSVKSKKNKEVIKVVSILRNMKGTKTVSLSNKTTFECSDLFIKKNKLKVDGDYAI